MTIRQNRENTKLTVAIEGRLDTSTAPELEAALAEALENVTELTLDCEKLEYVSSAGLRVILKTQKVMFSQGSMKLTHVNEEVMEVFEITGFSNILKFE
ncbi:MAG: STAS domain-containing protein [Candidatus Gallimonas sp.]